MSEQLAQLVKPFKDSLIHGNPSGGGSYVSHSAVTEKILAVLGPYRWECVEVIRGYVPGIVPNPSSQSKRGKEGRPALDNAVVGYVGRLSVTIDGVPAVYEEPGDCEDPHNWPHDGARLKDAASDSFKRCAMRAGVGLHLWSQYQGKSEFFIYDYLTKNAAPAHDGRSGSKGGGKDAEHGGMPPEGAVPAAASTRPPASRTAAPSRPNAAEYTALYNAMKAAERAQLRTLLVQNGIPQSVQEMSEDQAAEAIRIAKGETA